MYTSMMLTALAGLVAGRAPTAEVAWSADYGTARQAVLSEKKPLAVFLGSGENGYEKVCRDGALSKGAQEALTNKYVCVYIDMSTPAGQRLAKAFEIKRPSGLVLSDRGGNKQVFHHDGALGGDALTRALKSFANPKLVVRRTVTDLNAARTSSSPPAQNITNAPPRMSYYPPQNGGFQPALGFAMGFGGGCRGGG